MITSISYSKDNGNTWTTTNNVNNKAQNLVIDVSVNEGDKVLWKGDATQTCYADIYEGEVYNSFFSSTCEFDAEGNVMSLLYGDNFNGETTIEEEYAFGYLFSDYDEVKICSVVNAKNLSLPATTLTTGCYGNMFQNCTNLITAPELPATTLTERCYVNMFYNCTSLTTAPELPATTLAEGCYSGMFLVCTSLVTAPVLSATTLVNTCYEEMFQGCTHLNYIKAMFTTTPSSTYTYNWVRNVAASGTFVKNSTAQWNVSGDNGVPTNWTVQTASE